MKTFALLVFITSLTYGATTKQPSNCSSRPCTYTITCAAPTCTGAEVQEVQAALDDALRGDTIKLEAGRIFPVGSIPLRIAARSGSGYLTVTTTEDASLPPREMTRITQHWLTKMPVLRANGGNLSLWVECQPAATQIKIRGIVFDANGIGTQLLTLGCPTGGLLGRNATSEADQPDDVLVEHCIFRNNDWLIRQQSAYIAPFTRRCRIRNSWIAGGRYPGVEVQAIIVNNGPGPVDIINNYLADTGGETIMHGGTGPNWDVSPTGSMILNAIYNHPERMLGLNSLSPNWQAGTVVFKGRYIKHSNGWFMALNSGTTGSSTPAFPASGSVTDNGITWNRVAPSTAASQIIMKNLYECKNARGVVNAWNQYRGYTNQAQVQTIVYKLSNSPASVSTHSRCVPYYTGRVNTNGMTVTSADGNILPNNHVPKVYYNVDPYQIRIGSTNYAVGDFVWNDDFTLTLTTSAGNQSNVTYSYGEQGCLAAFNRDNQFMYNIVEDGTMGIEMVQFDNGMQSRIGNLLMTNNLFRRIDCQTWGGAADSGCEDLIGLPTPFRERCSKTTRLSIPNMRRRPGYW